MSSSNICHQGAKAPSGENHILHTTSVLSQVDYAPHFNKTLSPNIPYKDVNKVCLYYASFDKASTETIRLAAKPAVVKMGTAVALSELKTLDREGYTWTPLPDGGGILKVRHDNWHEIAIYSE